MHLPLDPHVPRMTTLSRWSICERHLTVMNTNYTPLVYSNRQSLKTCFELPFRIGSGSEHLSRWLPPEKFMSTGHAIYLIIQVLVDKKRETIRVPTTSWTLCTARDSRNFAVFVSRPLSSSTMPLKYCRVFLHTFDDYRMLDDMSLPQLHSIQPGRLMNAILRIM